MTTLWRWFVVPLGFPPIGWAHAYGLLILGPALAGSMRMGKQRPKDEPMDTAWTLGVALLLPLTELGFGWVACWLMT